MPGSVKMEAFAISSAAYASLVQAFAFDNKGEPESTPLRTARTDAAGAYVIEPLPGGSYFVGVNAERYKDTDTYPPTVFTAERGSSVPSRIILADGAANSGIDIALFEPDKEKGGFVVTFPDFDWGVTQGDTEEEAVSMAADARL